MFLVLQRDEEIGDVSEKKLLHVMSTAIFQQVGAPAYTQKNS